MWTPIFEIGLVLIEDDVAIIRKNGLQSFGARASPQFNPLKVFVFAADRLE